MRAVQWKGLAVLVLRCTVLCCSVGLLAVEANSIVSTMADLVSTPEQRCEHIRYEDVEFLLPYLAPKMGSLLNEGVDPTEKTAWPRVRKQLLNFDDTHCSRSERRPVDIVRKVFGVGYPRTGTSTLFIALRDLGLQVATMQPRVWDILEEVGFDDYFGLFTTPVEQRAVTNVRSKGLLARRFRSFWSRSHGSTDLPAALFYTELLDVFPKARFVLTVRHLKPWLQSAHRIFTNETVKPYLLMNRRVAFGHERFHPHLYTRGYLMHNENVLRTVPCCQLMVWDITSDPSFARLARFLQINVPPGKQFPWRNKEGLDT